LIRKNEIAHEPARLVPAAARPRVPAVATMTAVAAHPA
jgi:hypothetical protein